MLLSGKGGTGHDKHALLLRLFPLSLIDTTNRFQGEGITQGAPSAVACLVVVVGLRRIKEIGVGRVHPPAIDTFIKEVFQVLPVDGAGLGREGVIDTHTRGVVHAWLAQMEIMKWAFFWWTSSIIFCPSAYSSVRKSIAFHR